jgi:hypothetical protein
LLKVLEKPTKIKEAQAQFQRELGLCSEGTRKITIGGQWGHDEERVSYSIALGIWWTKYPLHNRFENGFGIVDDEWIRKRNDSIPLVIDIPFSGINRRVGGVFAVDENNQMYLLHRGKIGGGKAGIGKNLFLENYRGTWVTVQDGEELSNLALIGSLNSERFPSQVANFVKEVVRIKREHETRTTPNIPLPAIFREGFSGKRKYEVGLVENECDHNIVVNHLAKKLQSLGVSVGSKQPYDLYVLGHTNDAIILFEIKTDSSTTDCYQAAGQLFFHSNIIGNRMQLVAVFPDSLDAEYLGVFRQIGIYCITYRWHNGVPLFDDAGIAGLELH